MRSTLITNMITGSRSIVADIKDINDFHEVVNAVLSNNDELVSMRTKGATLKNIFHPFLVNIDVDMKDGGTGTCYGIPYVVDEGMGQGLIEIKVANKQFMQ